MDNAMKNKSKVLTLTDSDADRPMKDRIVRVLVVDNDDRIRKIHEDILETLGVETHSVKTGQEALERISYEPVYDLILIRRFLPVVDGAEVTKMLRDMQYPAIIIGVAHLREDQWKEFVSAGLNNCSGYEMPLNPKTVEMLVKNIPRPQLWMKRVNYNAAYKTFIRRESSFRHGQIYHSSSRPGSGSSSSSCK